MMLDLHKVSLNTRLNCIFQQEVDLNQPFYLYLILKEFQTILLECYTSQNKNKKNNLLIFAHCFEHIIYCSGYIPYGENTFQVTFIINYRQVPYIELPH